MKAKPPKYPFGTIAAYGPDNTLATKLVVAIIRHPGQREPAELRRWFTIAGDARNDPAIAAEVAGFLKKHGVKHTVTYDRIWRSGGSRVGTRWSFAGCPCRAGKPSRSSCPSW